MSALADDRPPPVRAMALALLLLAAACARAPIPSAPATAPLTTAPAASEPQTRSVSPAALDATVGQWTEPHLVRRDARVPAQGRLAVHLCGAGAKPQGDGALLELLAGWGFHAISLRYVNDYPIVDLCRGDPDPDCHGKLRLEAFEGQDHSRHIVVERQDGVEQRLVRLLVHLAKQHPDEGWDGFLRGGRPDWAGIVLSGHSHGASTAARIAKVRRLGGLVMLSGPFDNRDGQPATWIVERSATPSALCYGMTHVAEKQHAQHLVNFAALGLPGPPMSAEGAGASGPSHQLLVTSASPKGSSPHIVTIPGPWSPGDANAGYRLAAAWRFMWR